MKDEDNKAKIHKVIGKTAGFEEGAIFDIGDGLNGYVIRKSKSILVSDLEKETISSREYFWLKH